MHVPVGCADGQVPHAHVAPPPPTPAAAHEHSVVPYAQGWSDAQAPTGGVHVPLGWADGHAVHVVQVQTGLAPPPMPPQSQTALP